jgi:hypothetical protein
MQQQSVIQWDLATHEAAQRRTRGQQKRVDKMTEFLNSKCDLFSSQDFYYYAGETGQPIESIMKAAKFNTNIDTLLKNASIDNDYELINLLITNLI